MSESSGDTPDWLRQHEETPIKIFISTSSSEDDDDLPLVRRGAGAGLGAATGADGGSGTSQTPTAPPEAAVAQGQAASDSQQSPKLLQDIEQQSSLPASSQKPEQRKQVKAQSQQLPGGPSIVAHLGGILEAGRLPIMLPEKLNRNKVLLELPAAPTSGEHYHGAADLSGDSGAVGRIVVVGASLKGKGAAAAGSSQGSGLQLQVDLKGVVYNAWVLPLAASALVLNIGPTEAKVESLFNDFVRLRESVNPCDADTDSDNAGLAYLLDGDDENYQVGGDGGDGGEAPGQGAKAGKGPGKPRKRKATDKAAGDGPEKKAKISKGASTAAKTEKKGSRAAERSKKTSVGAARKKAAIEPKTATKAKKFKEPKKAAEAKTAEEKKPAEAKKTAATQGLGVKGGGVTKLTGASASAGRKTQITLTAFTGAAKPKGGSSK